MRVQCGMSVNLSFCQPLSQTVYVHLNKENSQGTLTLTRKRDYKNKQAQLWKKKLPRTRRLPRQWHVRNAGFARCVAPRVMLPSVVVTPKMLGIMAGMNQKDHMLQFIVHVVVLVALYFA